MCITYSVKLLHGYRFHIIILFNSIRKLFIFRHVCCFSVLLCLNSFSLHTNIYKSPFYVQCNRLTLLSMAMLSSLAAPEGVISTTSGTLVNPTAPPTMAAPAIVEGAVGLTSFPFQWASKDNSDCGAMCAVWSQWDQLNLIVASLYVLCRSYCYPFPCHHHFMLCLFILCYICRTITLWLLLLVDCTPR